MKSGWRKTKRWAVAIAMAAIPMELMVSCDPYSGSIDIYRYDESDYGFFDIFIIEEDYDDCFLFDCHVGHYDEIVIF